MSYFLIALFLGVSFFVYQNSQRTFEAKFKNIDGLPKGAPVTALGVKVGKVIKTKPVKDGIIVKIKITNKSFPIPQAGSELKVTSFRPNKGRILEIIPPREDTSNDIKAFIVQEPITTESWMQASLDLLQNLKNFSEVIIKKITPENFEQARLTLANSKDALDEIAVRLSQYEQNLRLVKDNFNELLFKLQKPISSLREIVTDKDFPTTFKPQFKIFSENLTEISNNVLKPEFITNLDDFKTMILDHLNQINASLTQLDSMVKTLELKQKIKDFNDNLTRLNTRYEELNQKNVRRDAINRVSPVLKEIVHKAREATTKVSESTKQN
ncbi:MAG: MCE family protein [Candidatus Melainabacteria bacterium]|nr:MCE family protein [Candidatus Melainabacteria bacterium]